MTEHEFMMSVLKSKRPESIRPGQQAFNMLHDVRPDLANTIRGDAMLDPFHMNENLPAFWAWLAEHWETNEAD